MSDKPCKCWDCGWCFAPFEADANRGLDGECTGKTECEYYKKINGDIIRLDNYAYSSEKFSTEIKVPPVSINFNSTVDGSFLGTFCEKDGLLTFEGNVDEAGKVFVNFICKTFNGRITELIKEGK